MSRRELLPAGVHLHWHDRAVQPRQAEGHSQRDSPRDLRALPRRQRDQDHQHGEVGPPQVALQIVSSKFNIISFFNSFSIEISFAPHDTMIDS